MNACIQPTAATTSEVSGLARIYEPSVNLMVLERPLDPALAAAASRLPVGTRIALRTRPETVADALRARLGSEHAPLAEEAARWAVVLADLLGAEELGLRLTVTDKATCPAFHVDMVTVRLITTWLGAGSEVLDEQDLDRHGLGYMGRGEALEASGLLRPGAQARRLPPQAIGLLKGEAWPGNAGRGVVHRSPAVPPGGHRVLLTIDALS